MCGGCVTCFSDLIVGEQSTDTTVNVITAESVETVELIVDLSKEL